MLCWTRKYSQNEIKYNDCIIGKILIDKPFPFAVIKLFDPEFSLFKNEKLIINEEDITILSWVLLIKILIGHVNTLGLWVQKIHFGAY